MHRPGRERTLEQEPDHFVLDAAWHRKLPATAKRADAEQRVHSTLLRSAVAISVIWPLLSHAGREWRGDQHNLVDPA